MNDIHISWPSLSDCGKVLTLYLIPIGGGIPAGVLLARKYSIAWPFMMILYFISDVILACVFEPLMLLFIKVSKRYVFLQKLGLAFQKAVQKTTSHYGTNLGPLALVMISFGVDPMTGRAAAGAAGHGFVSGWLIAISGDMIYFTVLMISTLWLNSLLGDGTLTMFIILFLMISLPPLFRKLKGKTKTESAG